MDSSLQSLPSFSVLSGSPTCCQHQEEYKKLYQQFSALRIEFRSTKAETLALRGTLKGLQQQNSLLKEFLNKKKSIIQGLNTKVEENEKEICRLEDQLRFFEEKDGKDTQIVEDLKKELNAVHEDFSRVKEEKINQNFQLQRQRKQLSNLKIEHDENTKKLLKQKEQELQRLNNTLKQTIQSLTCQISFSPSKKDEQNLHASPKLVKQIPSPAKSPTQNQLKRLLQNIEKQQVSTQAQLKQQKLSKERQSQKVIKLEGELAQMTELFDQQMNKIQQLKLQLEEKDKESNVLKQEDQKKNKHIDNMTHITQKLINLIQNQLPQAQSTLKKLIQLTKTPSKTFQSQILLRQLHTLSTSHFSQTLKQSIHSQRLQNLNRTHIELQEAYELLELKFSTLEREYRQILEDNSRLIRFSSISKYRISRNISGPLSSTRAPPGQTEKENTPNVLNGIQKSGRTK